MDITQLTSKDIGKISSLLEKRETLRAQIADIDRTLEHWGSGEPARPAGRARAAKSSDAEAPSSTRKRGRKKARRGQLKEEIVSALQGAGKEGLSVKDLASQLGRKYGNISVWFQSTAKKVKDIKKVGPARFAWVG